MSIQYPEKETYGMEDLIRIMELLRSENGCPWDRKQTHQSIRKDLIEETYEAAEAIDLDDQSLLKEELGDVLFQVVFHSRIAEEEGHFDFEQVCDGICRKMIERHPHVFGNDTADTADAVLIQWDQIKKDSKGQKTCSEAAKSVSRALPALMRAQKVQKRAARSGFDYLDEFWAMDDLDSELDELQEAACNKDEEACREELGDVLFAAVNVARKLDVDAEECLTQSTEKYLRRFEQMEKLAEERNIRLDPEAVPEMKELWDEAKEKLRGQK